MSIQSPEKPLLKDAEFQNLCKELLKSGEISSDGELSDIARQEFSKQTIDVQVASTFVKDNLADWIKADPFLIIPENPTTGSNPSQEDYAGPLGFDVGVSRSGNCKSKEAQYSETLKKIYINQNRLVNIEFRFRNFVLEDSSPLEPLYVRALCIFTNPDDIGTPVKVCYTHSRDSSGNLKSSIAEHLVRCSHSASSYQHDQLSGRHSVVTPFPDIQPGSKHSSLAYKFMDLGSCSGGLNRRETSLIFTLEDSMGKVIGRRVLQLRICTCPKRDCEQDENRYQKTMLVSSNSSGKRKNFGHAVAGHVNDAIVQAGKRKAYWVLAFGEENYQALKNIGETLEKKDGGDVQNYNEVMARFNQQNVGPTLPKKPKKEILQ